MAELRREVARVERDTGRGLEAVDWSRLPTAAQKEAMQRALWAEQFGLCAYCQQKIHPRRGDTPATLRIEHLKPRKSHPSLMFEWPNLVAVCPGVTEGVRHCDELRGDHLLSLDPTHRAIENRVRLDPDPVKVMLGRSPALGLRLDTDDERIERDLRLLLGLNTALLSNRRYKTRETLRDTLRRIESRNPSKARRMARDGLRDATSASPGSTRPAFSRVHAAYFESKLRHWQ